MEASVENQLSLVLKQENDRLLDRKNVIELNINRITKVFQNLNQELFQGEIKTVELYSFELKGNYLGWVYDKHKGFRSKSGRSQSLRQWLNSTKARKWADSLFGDMFESCRDYAWKVGHCLEDNSEGIEYLTNYLQCEYFIAIMTGAISSGSGSGSRPLICDHSFHKRNSKMLNILNEGTYNNKNLDNDYIPVKSKDKKEGNVVKDHFVDLYKKWSDRYFALYIIYKTERRHGLRTTVFQKRSEVMKGSTTMDVNMQIDKPKIKIEQSIENAMDQAEHKYNNFEDGGECDSERDDEENGDDDDGNSSDEPISKIESQQIKNRKDLLKKEQETIKQEREKNNERMLEKKLLQKLNRQNKELKDNVYQMANKIQQLTNYYDLKISSLYTQLNTWKQLVSDAESKGIAYEDRIKSMIEQMAVLNQEKNALYARLMIMPQRPIINNGDMHGYYDNSSSDGTHTNVPWHIPFFNSVPNSDVPSLIENRSHSFLTNNNPMNSGDEAHTMDTMTMSDFGPKRTSITDLGFGGGGQMIFDWNYNNSEDFAIRRNSSIQSTRSMNVD